MATNGKRRPPRPEIIVTGGTASPQETAAIAAALERFLAETASVAERAEPGSRWLRAALVEGVDHAPRLGSWG